MAFSSVLNLSSLNGSNGFTINGSNSYHRSGNSVSNAGDVNGDGIADLVIGASNADPNDRDFAGQTYIVFGKSQKFAPRLSLSNLNGSNGFILNGINEYDFSGNSVSNAGDINGDGIADLAIGAFSAEPKNRDFAGQTYIVFGKSNGFISSFSLSSLNGKNGFTINGINKYDQSGKSVSNAGDINGDGITDLAIGATGSDVNGRNEAGQTYILFGKSEGFTSSLSLSSLNGKNGFTINGINSYDQSGKSVSNAGDINGDGIADLAIGAPNADPNGNSLAGQTYIVFGKSKGFTSSFNLSSLNGSNGFIINGISESSVSGASVSNAGDLNGDGIADLAIGAKNANVNGNNLAGQTYILFGKSKGFTSSFDLSSLNGSNGFTINGIDSYNYSGTSVSNAGDLNGDGLSDLAIGASGADANGNNFAGQTYIVFGSTNGFASSFNLSSLNGNNGFTINGINSYDQSGDSVSNAGDVNGDGVADLAIGADYASSNGYYRDGQTYIVFGQASTPSLINGDNNNNLLNGTGKDDIINGLGGNDTLNGLMGNDNLNGGTGNDRLTGGTGNDILTGGATADSFSYSTGKSFSTADVGVDRITDFSHDSDSIVLSKTTFQTISSKTGTGFSDKNEFALVKSDSKAATSDADIVYNSSNGKLFYNVNGNNSGFGTGGQFALLTASPTLEAGDFVIVG